MKRSYILALCLGVSLVGFGIPGVTASAQPNSKAPVAYIYVVNSAGGNATEISAFVADSKGRLSRVPGSPFMENAGYMVVNGKYLMTVSGSNINSYRIAKDGSLSFAVATNYQQVEQPGCGFPSQLVFDHSGKSLYVTEAQVDCANNGVTNWAVDWATGALDYLGLTDTGTWNINAAYFTGNDKYAYTAYNDSCMYYSMNRFTRAANGMLTESTSVMLSPKAPAKFRAYIPYLGAADPTNHVAFAEYPANPPGCTSDPVQLATYTANSNGSLTTTSTSTNMPTTAIRSVYDMKMSPTGKLLAVAGQQGLQVFHFHGASPITHYTGLLTKDPINQMFWDNSNHLYAITGVHGSNANRLHVYTITPTGSHEAPGSPYKINGPQYIIVQPLARQ